MSISDTLLPEFDHEVANTRRTLERVPDDRLAWRPHAKSFTLGALASHIANLHVWCVETLRQDSFDVGIPNERVPNVVVASRAELLERYDAGSTAARAAIVDTTDARWMAPWSLLDQGATLFTLPRVVCVRSFVMNHLIHHRGQLTVYLRLNDLPVPALYGPSADERGPM